jgi:hypothetical protein
MPSKEWMIDKSPKWDWWLKKRNSLGMKRSNEKEKLK